MTTSLASTGSAKRLAARMQERYHVDRVIADDEVERFLRRYAH